jgi:hypothetical protein
VLILAGIGGMAAVLRPTVPVAEGIIAWTVAGLGMGLAYAPLSLMMLREAPPGREGWASASLNLSDVLGTAVGVGLGGAAVAAGSRGSAVTTGLTVAFCVAGAGAVVAFLVTPRLPLRGIGSTRRPASPAVVASGYHNEPSSGLRA